MNMHAQVAFSLFCLIAVLMTVLKASSSCVPNDISLVCRGIITEEDFPLSIPLHVQRVKFDGTEFLADSFPKGLFSNTTWRNLTELVIVDFQNVKCIHNTFLEGLVGLKYLSISSCYGINLIESEAFRSTPNLEALHLEMLLGLAISIVEEALVGNLNSLKYLSLIHLNVNSNALILGKNFTKAFSGKNITYLDISRSKVVGFYYDFYVKVLFNLKYFNISSTFIPLFRGFSLDGPELIFTEINFPNWEVFDASGCPSFVVYRSLSENVSVPGYNLIPKLKYIFLSNIATFESTAVSANFIIDLSRLNAEAVFQVIDISNNKLVHVNLTVLGTYKFQELQKLDLSRNGMEYIAPSLLRSFPLLKILNMAENNLRSMQTKEDFSNLFSSTTELRVLSLRNNHLTAIPKTCFSSNTKLQLLDLRQNDLNDFNIDLSNMWGLKYIDLRNNRLHNLPLGTILTLENISLHQMTKAKSNESNDADILSLYRLDKTFLAARYGYGQSIDMTRELPEKEEHMYWNLTIDLYGNPLQCDCKSIYFLQWIISTNIIIVDMESLVCKYGNDQYPLNKETLDKVHFDCVSFPTLIKIIVLSVTIGIVFASVFAFLALYIRRTSRRAKNMELLKRLIQKDDAKFKFVVFLPFCSQDQDIVEKYIRPSLNNLLKQKLNINIKKESELVCCGDRNFIPGLPIITEIHRCIDESLVVVPVITPSFLKSRWCKSECTVAIQKARNVVVLMEEKTDTSDADKMIRNLIHKYTRASWAAKDGEFMIRPKWDILIQSIVDKAMETACNRRKKTENKLNRREEAEEMVGLLDSEEEEEEL